MKTVFAKHKLGFEYIGFELDADYWKSAKERLEAEQSRISIFDEPIAKKEYEQIKIEV
jgi:hypothetical protein